MCLCFSLIFFPFMVKASCQTVSKKGTLLLLLGRSEVMGMMCLMKLDMCGMECSIGIVLAIKGL